MSSSPLSVPHSRLKNLMVIIVLVVLVGLVGGYFLRTTPVSVALTKVARGNVEAAVSNTRAGTVKACRRAKLSAPAGGQIARMAVKKGDRVQAGQTLLELWRDDLQAQHRLALDQLQTAQIRVREVCSVAEAAQRDAERSKELTAKGFISSQQLDRTLTDAKSRLAACDAARSDIAQSNSRIAVAQQSLQRMVLRAPFAGVVADISGELGEYATPSPPGILTLPAIDLIDDSCLFVSAPIDEVDAAKLKVGQPARITLDAIKGRTFAGTVRRIAPYVLELEKQARTVEVEVAFSELPSADNLLVGYSADVEIVHAAHENVLRIPTPTLMEGKRVLLFGSDGKLQAREVVTGLTNWQYSEVVAGLTEGEKIVVSLDKPGVKAGTTVQVESAGDAKK